MPALNMQNYQLVSGCMRRQVMLLEVWSGNPLTAARGVSSSADPSLSLSLRSIAGRNLNHMSSTSVFISNSNREPEVESKPTRLKNRLFNSLLFTDKLFIPHKESKMSLEIISKQKNVENKGTDRVKKTNNEKRNLHKHINCSKNKVGTNNDLVFLKCPEWRWCVDPQRAMLAGVSGETFYFYESY